MSSNSFFVTSASTLQGYHIAEYCGMVFGEKAAFGVNLKGSIIGGLSEAFAAWGKAADYGSQAKVVYNAREEVFNSIIHDAKAMGADAIIALHTDNTVTDSVVFLSMYGTAVRLITEEQYEDKKRIEAENRERKKQDEREKQSLHHKKLDEAFVRKASGDNRREVEFLNRMSSVSSIREISNLWDNSKLGEIYYEINGKIMHLLKMERLYGRMPGDLEKLKTEIQNALMDK